MSALIEEAKQSLTTWINYLPFAIGTAFGAVGDSNVRSTVPYVGRAIIPAIGLTGAVLFRKQPVMRTVGEGVFFGAVVSEILSAFFPQSFAARAMPGYSIGDAINAVGVNTFGYPALLQGQGTGNGDVLGFPAAMFTPDQGYTTIHNQDQSLTMNRYAQSYEGYARPDNMFSQANYSRPGATFSNDGNNSFVAGFNEY